MSNSPGIKKVLVLTANPLDTKRLRLEEEVREIQEGLQRSKYREQIKFESRWAMRVSDLREALLYVQPQIVHFSGHGIGEKGLLFEDEQGNSKPVSTEALANLFKLFAGEIECVVLNACYAQVQAKAIIPHVGYVIGMNQAIVEKAAISFSVGFYDALGGGRCVEDAHKFGCNAIELEGIPQHLIPTIEVNTALKAAFAPKAITVVKSTKPGATIDRRTLIRQLNDLSLQDFEALLLVVKIPNKSFPPSTLPQGDRTAALLRWAQTATGCGLELIQEELDNILGE